MTLRRCTRHESCSTSTEQTGITRSAHWADWKVVGGRSAGSRHWRISGMWCMLTGSERGLLIARHATEAICCSAFVDTGEQKSYLHVQKEHGFTPTWLTIQNFGRNHIQFLHRHHYQSTRQYDSILKTCLKWESTSLPSDAPARRRTLRPAVGHASFSCLWSRLYLCFNFQRECYFQAVHDAAFRVIRM